MSHRSLLVAPALALLMGALAPTALGADPTANGQLAGPITNAERSAADAKTAAAATYLATPAAGTSTLCPAPNSAGGPMTQVCPVPSGFLAVEARDQIKGTYCGPAVGQVISNYAWAMGAGLNKFTQQQLAGWMGTDVNGGTSAQALANGLNTATNGSPRRPGNFVYLLQLLSDFNGNGTAGDEWHGYVRTDISQFRMPLAVAVKPHQPGAHFYLISWPREVWSVGHWITIYGWRGLWDGGDFARVYYADSSRDEGGSTGKFSDPSRHVYILIKSHTNVIVW